MSHNELLGLLLLAIAAYNLIPAYGEDAWPSRWPMKPVRRAERPEAFWFGVGLSAIIGAIGLGILIGSLLRRAVL